MMSNQQGPSYAELQAIVKTYRPLEDLLPEHWSEGDVFANGIRHHYYRTGGEKPALLLLHGFNEYGLTWLRVAKELEQDYDIIMVDARGHGRSDGIAPRVLSVRSTWIALASSAYRKGAQQSCVSRQRTLSLCTPSSLRGGVMKPEVEQSRTPRATRPGLTAGLPGLNS